MADPQRAAILRLLDDDDAATVALVRGKLAETFPLPELQTLRAQARGRAAQHLDALVAELASAAADRSFGALCGRFGEHGDLEQASWALAEAFAPGEDFSKQRALLDAWGREVAGRLANAQTKAARVRTLAEYLGRELRLRGNDDDYYSVDNSLLPRVIDSRLGIPISLSLVYLLVGRRAGLDIQGVGLPGHFLARHEDVFFDPFHGGRRVGMEECAAMMEEQNLVLTPQHLIPTTSRQMLIRMLTNLYFIADQTDPPLAGKVSGWVEMLREPRG